MANEKKQVIKEMREMCKCMRAVGIDFIVCIDEEQKGKVHNLSTDANVRDDHHYMDMMAAITETWWKANHKEG